MYRKCARLLTCCISTLARLLLIFLKSDVFRLFSWWTSRFCLRCRCNDFLANLPCHASRLRPPALMEVFSKGVARSVTLSPPDTKRCNTWVWYNPCKIINNLNFEMAIKQNTVKVKKLEFLTIVEWFFPCENIFTLKIFSHLHIFF